MGLRRACVVNHRNEIDLPSIHQRVCDARSPDIVTVRRHVRVDDQSRDCRAARSRVACDVHAV